MKIAIRMDDITPDMDWTRFLKFKELCDLYKVKPLIGVVPKNEDKNLSIDAPRADFWEYIRGLQKDGWTIAQHGYTHVYATNEAGIFPLNHFSEFAGVEYSEQYEAIRLGQNILKENGIETDIFMPPAHSFDKYTLKALDNLCLRRVTDGFGKYPYLRNNIVFYPISHSQKAALKARRGYTTFVVHSNTMEAADFKRYKRMFKRYRDRLISYSELLEAEPEFRGAFGNLKEYLMAAAKSVILKKLKNLKNKVCMTWRQYGKSA